MGGGIFWLAGRCLLTTEKQLIAPVRSWQLTNVFYPMAHYPGKVTSVVEASHNDAVQVHGFDEGAEESTLEPKDVPPEKKFRSNKTHAWRNGHNRATLGKSANASTWVRGMRDETVPFPVL